MKVHVLIAGCSLFRAEGFSCSLDVPYGTGISKFQLLTAVIFFSNFVHQNLEFGSGYGFSLKGLIQIQNTAYRHVVLV